MSCYSSLYTRIQDAASKRLIRERRLSWEKPPVFEAAFFEVVNQCNSRCEFCSASVQNDTRERREMSFALYSMIIEQLVQMNFSGRVAYHVANDPLVFGELESFTAHARARLPRCWIQIMTNGIALTPKRGEALIESGIDELYINFYKTSRTQALYPNIAKFLADVLEKRFPRKRGAIYTSGDGKAHLKFTLSPRRVTEVLWSRGGTSPNKGQDDARVRGFCLYPWTQLNISTDGLVSKCCADTHFTDVMGDLKEESLAAVWNGARLTHVRNALMRGDRLSLPGCRQCDYFGVPTSAISNLPLKAVKYHLFAKY